MKNYPNAYKNPIMQIRCAQESMLECCISYMKNLRTGKVEYCNFHRGPKWAGVNDYKSYPTPYSIQQSKMIANKLIWC